MQTITATSYFLEHLLFPEPPRSLKCRKTYNELIKLLGLPEQKYHAPKSARETLEECEAAQVKSS